MFKNGVAGAEPPYRSSAICATASCSGFVWLTACILAGTRGGSPTLSPGMDAGRVCTRALQDAKPTKHTQPFTTGKGFGVRVREFALFYKNRLFLQPEEEIPRLFFIFPIDKSPVSVYTVYIIHKQFDHLLCDVSLRI